MQPETLRDLELEAWSQRASIYDDLFAGMSAQAIAPILNALGDLQGRHLLDIACGTGHLVAAASKRGAISLGTDFAEPMIEVARKNYPNERYEVADATQLPYDAGRFDAVTCTFGLSHMEFPQAAMAEAFRILKPDGRFAFTLWCSADDGGELFAIGRDAIGTHATTPVYLPDSWTQLRFGDKNACALMAKSAGFSTPRFETLPIALRTISSRAVLDVFAKLAVRTKLILDSQTPTVKQRIYDHILAEAETRRADGLITISWPALLTVVEKPF